MVSEVNRNAAAQGPHALTMHEVRQTFIDLGCEWYATHDDNDRAEVLEEQAVVLLRDNPGVTPTVDSLKRDVRNVSFVPSVVEHIWWRAFPLTIEDKATQRVEWQMLHGIAARIRSLSASGESNEAEALRKSAITFFNRWLTEDEIDQRISKEVRKVLRRGNPPSK